MQIFRQFGVDFAAPAESAINDLGEQSSVALIHRTVFEGSIEQDVGIGFLCIDFGENLSRASANAQGSFFSQGDHRL